MRPEFNRLSKLFAKMEGQKRKRMMLDLSFEVIFFMIIKGHIILEGSRLINRPNKNDATFTNFPPFSFFFFHLKSLINFRIDDFQP